jgi:hypothetical protein
MATKETTKTREEMQAELDQEKRNAWENFQKLEYDKMSEEERVSIARHLYETMNTTLAPEEIDLPFDFWKDYDNTDEIRDINKFIGRVTNTLTNLPQNPTRASWLDKDRGIVPSLKREWREKVEPFKNEQRLREQFKKKATELFNSPDYQDKKISVDLGKQVQKALENIEETLYKPTREMINHIEEEIKKRTN